MTSHNAEEREFNIVMLGESNCGKSELIKGIEKLALSMHNESKWSAIRLAGAEKISTGDAFIDANMPITKIVVNRKSDNSALASSDANFTITQLMIRDTPGSHEFDSIRPLTYAPVDLVVLCYAVDNVESLHAISRRWIHNELSRYYRFGSAKKDALADKNSPRAPPVVLLGCKSDLRQSFSRKDKLQDSNGHVMVSTPPQTPDLEKDITVKNELQVGLLEAAMLAQEIQAAAHVEASAQGTDEALVKLVGTLIEAAESGDPRKSKCAQSWIDMIVKFFTGCFN